MHNFAFLYLVLSIVGFLYIVGPILIYFVQKIPAKPQFQVIGPETLPPEIVGKIVQAWASLEPAGFTLIAYLSLPNHMPNVYPILAYCINWKTGDTAAVTAVYASQEGVYRLKVSYVEFNAHYDDGSGLDTSNNGGLSSFAPNPSCPNFRFRKINDIGYLYQLHRALVQRYYGERKMVLPVRGEEIEFLSHNVALSCEGQTNLGLLKFDAGASVYRPTVRGAFYMTWAILWPMNAIRKMGRDRQAESLMSELKLPEARAVV
jgi:hypothetical protein